jgi:hypothetical protein
VSLYQYHPFVNKLIQIEYKLLMLFSITHNFALRILTPQLRALPLVLVATIVLWVVGFFDRNLELAFSRFEPITAYLVGN